MARRAAAVLGRFSLPTENGRRQADAPFENAAEVGRVLVTEFVGDLRHRRGDVDQAPAGFQQQALLHQFGGGSSSPYGYFGEKGSWSNPY